MFWLVKGKAALAGAAFEETIQLRKFTTDKGKGRIKTTTTYEKTG